MRKTIFPGTGEVGRFLSEIDFLILATCFSMEVIRGNHWLRREQQAMNWYAVYKLAAMELTFSEENTASYSGQSNMRLYARRGDRVVGWLDYVIFGDEISISYVHATERRQGVGSALQYELQRMYPDTEIKHGGMTDDGHALYKSLKKRLVPNQKTIELKQEHERNHQEIARLEAIFDTDVAYGDKQAAHNRLSDLYDRQWTIERDRDFNKNDHAVFLDHLAV